MGTPPSERTTRVEVHESSAGGRPAVAAPVEPSFGPPAKLEAKQLLLGKWLRLEEEPAEGAPFDLSCLRAVRYADGAVVGGDRIEPSGARSDDSDELSERVGGLNGQSWLSSIRTGLRYDES